MKIQEFGKDTFTEIAMKTPEEPHNKTLGVRKLMKGNDVTHINDLKTRSFNISSIVATRGLLPHQADVTL